MAKKPKDVWGIPIPSASDVVSFLNNAVNAGRVASGDKQAVTPGDAGVRTLGRGISLTNDYLNPYANTTKQLLGMAAGNEGAQAKFAKSLARDVAITGAGAGIGVGAVKGVKAAQEAGLGARAVNAVTGKKIIVVGTKSNPVVESITKTEYMGDIYNFANDNSVTKGKFLPTVPGVVREPQTIFSELKDTPVRWGWDPAKSRSMRELTEDVTEYSNRWYSQGNMVPRDLPGGGRTIDFRGYFTPEIAIAKVPKSSVRYEPVMPKWTSTDEQIAAVEELLAGKGSVNNPVFRSGAVASTSPAKIVSTVSPVMPKGKHTVLPYSYTKPLDVVERELAKAIKRAGGRLPKK